MRPISTCDASTKHRLPLTLKLLAIFFKSIIIHVYFIFTLRVLFLSCHILLLSYVLLSYVWGVRKNRGSLINLRVGRSVFRTISRP